MIIELTPEMEAIVVGQLNSGRYSSATAVVEEALASFRPSKQRAEWSGDERKEKVRITKELFDEINAAGGFEFHLNRDTRQAEERERW